MHPDQRPPDNHLVWAILSTVMCCVPLGIVAIIKASKVNDLWYQGRYEEAIKHAEDAKKWSIYSAVSILAIFFLSFFFYFVVAIFAVIIEGV